MINTIQLKFGASSDQAPLKLELTPLTVFVGPNNSGKSKVLKEIESYCRQTSGQPNDVVLDAVEFTSYSREEMQIEIDRIKSDPLESEIVEPGKIVVDLMLASGLSSTRIQLHEESLFREGMGEIRNSHWIKQLFSAYTLRLDGSSRLNLLETTAAGDLKATPTNILAYLFKNDDVRRKLRKTVFDAFGKYFVIDPTHMGRLSVRLADREPVNTAEEKSWEDAAVEYHKAAMSLSLASDGVRAFVGTVATLLAGTPKVALIDEPEAFLPPPIALKLGKVVSEASRESENRYFVATHNASFLMGCIQSGEKMNIVRLTYLNGGATARLLPSEKLAPLMRDPLLRSTGVLNALFYESVVVTESDADRAFYQEINERLLAESDDRGISNCLFLNAQNKHTIWRIVTPLRELGIPTVGVVDIDAIKDKGENFNKLLKGSQLPKILHGGIQLQRSSIFEALESTGKDMKKEGGINILSGDEKDAMCSVLKSFAEYGAFIVPGGELESWLKYLGATGHSPGWLVQMFEIFGDTPVATDYVKPAPGDVWDFIGEVKKWLVDPNRKGIPNQ